MNVSKTVSDNLSNLKFINKISLVYMKMRHGTIKFKYFERIKYRKKCSRKKHNTTLSRSQNCFINQ